MDVRRVKRLAHECGFELAGIAPAAPLEDARFFDHWVQLGYAGEMRYLTDHRGKLRNEPNSLLPSARTIICVGKLYNGPQPYSNTVDEAALGWISRYAWGEDYHSVLRAGLEELAGRLQQEACFEYKICVDTAPLLERAYARQAGLGWIGKNTCVINQDVGSWFFLGELLTSLRIDADEPVAERCGSCTRCIDACPTGAIIPGRFDGGPRWTIDSRLCISYFTIEKRGAIAGEHRAGIGRHIFGCDICQDVCPWNGRAAMTTEPAFAPRQFNPPLEELADISEARFHEMFRGSAIKRARYTGFLRNVAIAMGNAHDERFRPALERLAQSEDSVVAEHARWGLDQIAGSRKGV